MKSHDLIEDRSSGAITARVNRTQLSRVILAKHSRGELVYVPSRLTQLEARRNDERRTSGEWERRCYDVD